jgi:predicted small lipoprotein YifL
MKRVRLVGVLVAALPLAGCGNKGPLIRPPAGASDMPGATAPAPAGSFALPPGNATVMPPSASTLAPDTPIQLRDDATDSHDDADATPTPPVDGTQDDDGTPGTPR